MRQAGAYSGILSGRAAARTGPHALPLARIKKIMKRSGEAPIIFSKACELFIEELVQRGWAAAVQSKRRTLNKEDVATAVMATDVFDFLVDMVAESNDSRALHET